MRNNLTSSWVALGLAAAVSTTAVAAGGPSPKTLAGWTAYVTATEHRMSRELDDGTRFLALDFGETAASDRQTLTSGTVLVRRMRTMGETGRAIDVPSGLVHHWRGAVMIPGVRIGDLMRRLQTEVPDTGQEDVLESRVLSREQDAMVVFLKLRRTRFITVVYDTEHRVHFGWRGSTRAFSESAATKIAEVASPGTPAERELSTAEDQGFLWRWNVYWRYEQTPDGVIAECESISLSRGLPFGLRSLLGPIVEGTARDSMTRTLTSLRSYFQRRV